MCTIEGWRSCNFGRGTSHPSNAWTLEFYLERAGHNAEYPIYEEKERILGIGDIKTFSFLSSRFKLAIIAIRFGFMLSSRSGVSIYHGQIGP